MSLTELPIASQHIAAWICLRDLPTRLDRDFHHPAPPIPLRPPITHNELRWYRNIDLLSIDYAFRPRLRTD